MKFIKFLTRKYTLFEHWLIAESLLKKNTSIAGIYYKKVMDISKNGLVDIYIMESDLKRNKKWVYDKVKKDPDFVDKILRDGMNKASKLSQLPEDLPKKIKKLTNDEIIREILFLKQRFVEFSGYVDFTHYLGNLNIKLSNQDIKNLSKFHEYRKEIFMRYFKFLNKVLKEIAKMKKVESENLSFLHINEIILFLKGDISLKNVDRIQKIRRNNYVAKNFNGKNEIHDIDYEKELKKVEKLMINEEGCAENDNIIIKGMGVSNGVIRGIVKIIDQNNFSKNNCDNKVIVTQMTSPEMTSVLKKVKAIITDEGGILCHAANIAREFGTVAIIGTKIATKVLKDGDLVEVDADKGVVKIIK